ncbi:hypothetical protein BTVI_143104 [Pitangus sulphuratus]|nr:hypothetical protein BTVI_143104 [Pitangus sulphuratus]
MALLLLQALPEGLPAGVEPAQKMQTSQTLAFDSPVSCDLNLDKTGFQTSVIADCLYLLALITWTPTEPS